MSCGLAIFVSSIDQFSCFTREKQGGNDREGQRVLPAIPKRCHSLWNPNDSLNPIAGFRESLSHALLHFLNLISLEIVLHGFGLLRTKRNLKKNLEIEEAGFFRIGILWDGYVPKWGKNGGVALFHTLQSDWASVLPQAILLSRISPSQKLQISSYFEQQGPCTCFSHSFFFSFCFQFFCFWVWC